MNIEEVPIGNVKANKNNPRIIKDEKFKKLVESIRNFPQMLKIRPIVVNDDMIVLGGNMRLKACKEAGLKTVHIIKASGLTEKQQDEFIVKDNVGFGEWDWEMLANEWDAQELDAWGLDLPDMFDDEPEETVGDDEVPEVPVQPETVIGDLWELGEHRLLCGDSTSVDAVEKLMDGKKADMVYTDPPYGMELDADYSKMGGKKYDNVIGDFEKFDFAVIFSLVEAKQWFVWGADYFFDTIPNYFDGSLIVWTKRMKEDENKVFGSAYELCWAYPKMKKEVWFENGINQSSERLGEHPTQKPTALAVRAIEKKGADSKIILDFFGGSGSTLIACEMKRKANMSMELDPKYCDVIVKRYVKFCKENNREWSVKLNGEEYKGGLLDE